MAKSKYMTNQRYRLLLSEMFETIQEAGNQVAPFFEKIDNALKKEELDKMSVVEFKEIATAFENTVDIYQDVSKKFNQIIAPVRLIGLHKNLQQIFTDYTTATKQMADALDVATQDVNIANFRDSEAKQDKYMNKFLTQIRRIFTSIAS